MAGRFALILANWEYEDPRLKRLVTPERDADGLAVVLRAPDIGGFDDVKICLNGTRDQVEEALEVFFLEKKPDDLLLVYFSGHGIRDTEGHLYLAVKNTKTRNEGVLTSTAVAAQQIAKFLDTCRSRSQVLILDCCHSGAFSQGMKAAVGSFGTKHAFEGNGYGRWVLTATDATQYAWEGDKVSGENTQSIFTRYLIEGLSSGGADVNNDGLVTVEEIYQYVHGRIRESGAKQSPHKWSYKQKGDVLIAKRPRTSSSLVDKKPISWKIFGLVGTGVIVALVGLIAAMTNNHPTTYKPPQSAVSDDNTFVQKPDRSSQPQMAPDDNTVVPRPYKRKTEPDNDGSDVTRPILSSEDEKVIDRREGREWSQRCEDHINTGQLGWARAACARGLAMPNLPGRVRGSLLYNLGRVYRAAEDTDSARRYFQRALDVDDITDHQRTVFGNELGALR